MSIVATDSPASREGGPVAQPVAAPTDSGRSSAPADKTREEILYGDTAAKADPPVAETEADAADKPPEPKAAGDPPATYDLKAPEGLEIDQGMLTEAAPVFRELNLDNEGANKLMPLAGKLIDRIAAHQHDQFSIMKKGWADETMADPVMGGQRWPETERLVATALNAVGAGKGSELRALLDQSGIGNHPAMIRAFRHFGSLVAGKPVEPASREQILYGATTRGARA